MSDPQRSSSLGSLPSQRGMQCGGQHRCCEGWKWCVMLAGKEAVIVWFLQSEKKKDRQAYWNNLTDFHKIPYFKGSGIEMENVRTKLPGVC